MRVAIGFAVAAIAAAVAGYLFWGADPQLSSAEIAGMTARDVAALLHEQDADATTCAAKLEKHYALSAMETAEILCEVDYDDASCAVALRDVYDLGPTEIFEALREAEWNLDKDCVSDICGVLADLSYEDAQDVFDECAANGLDGCSLEILFEALKCEGFTAFQAEDWLLQKGYEEWEILEVTALEAVEKLVPVLLFDKKHSGLPMPAEVYFRLVMNTHADSASTERSPEIHIDPRSGDPPTVTWVPDPDGPHSSRDHPYGPPLKAPDGSDNCMHYGGRPWCVEVIDARDHNDSHGLHNTDFSSLTNGEVPTYFQVISDRAWKGEGRLRIQYWWFYGWQPYCNPWKCTGPTGEHHGDWESIVVTTTEDRSEAEAVTYTFHGQHYTRVRNGPLGGIPTNVDGRPLVWVGKVAHGGYHVGGGGSGSGTPFYCEEFADWRNPDWNSIWGNAGAHLVSLRSGSESWMLADQVDHRITLWELCDTIVGESHYACSHIYEWPLYPGLELKILHWRWGPYFAWKKGGCKWAWNSAVGTHPTQNPPNWSMASTSNPAWSPPPPPIPPMPIPRYLDEGSSFPGGWPNLDPSP
jgi:hypothetical protein